MSKSRGNVVSPASIVQRVGADTARCYILFVGPPDQDADWSDAGVEGIHRFLSRLYRLAAEVSPAEIIEEGPHVGRSSIGPPGTVHAPSPPTVHAPSGNAYTGDDLVLMRKAHWAIEKVSSDVRRFAFNTAIAAVMELLNECSRLRAEVEIETLRTALATAASLLFPFAPHVSAEIYALLTGERVWEQPWPRAEAELLEAHSYEIVCQVNGKLRDRVQAAADASEADLVELCRSAPNVRAHLDGKELVKEVVVPGKLVNLVVR
jgi:leucyl-tRNA synthetase